MITYAIWNNSIEKEPANGSLNKDLLKSYERWIPDVEKLLISF